MLSEKEIEDLITHLKTVHKGILDRRDVTPFNNALVSSLQMEVVTRIHCLEMILGRELSVFPCIQAVFDRLK